MPQEGMDVQQERRPVGEDPPSSSLNVTKAAAHKERWREDIKCALLNEAG